MVKARNWLVLALISLATAAATVSCGSDEMTGGGIGGGLITGGSGGTSGAVNRGGSGGAAATSPLGKACMMDADCGAGLVCLPPSDPDVGPAHGLCTAACQTNADCDAISPGANCAAFGSNAYCLESCTQGDPGPNIAGKCHGRLDEACVEYASSDGLDTSFLCAPLCARDADCGSGLFCDHSFGLGQCSATKPVGDPDGTPCDPTATTSSCAGFCLQTSSDGVSPVTGACATWCSVSTDCNYEGTKARGACVGLLSTPFGAIDLGYCESGCSCDGDCALPADICQTWPATLATFQPSLGTDGICLGGLLSGSTELTCTGDGGAGAGGAGAGGASGTPPGGDTAGAAGN